MKSNGFENENAFQAKAIKELEKLDFWVMNMNPATRRGRRGVNSGEPGMPDLLLVGIGWIELKQPGNDLDPPQAEWHAKARLRNVRVATAWHLSEVLEIALSWREDHRKALSAQCKGESLLGALRGNS